MELPWSAVVPGSAGSSREETRYFTEYRTLQYGSYSTVAACYQNTTDGWRFILPPALYDQYWMDALTLSRRAETREVIFRRYTGSLNETGEEYLRLRVVSAAEGTEPGGLHPAGHPRSICLLRFPAGRQPHQHDTGGRRLLPAGITAVPALHRETGKAPADPPIGLKI